MSEDVKMVDITLSQETAVGIANELLARGKRLRNKKQAAFCINCANLIQHAIYQELKPMRMDRVEKK